MSELDAPIVSSLVARTFFSVLAETAARRAAATATDNFCALVPVGEALRESVKSVMNDWSSLNNTLNGTVHTSESGKGLLVIDAVMEVAGDKRFVLGSFRAFPLV